MTTLLVLKLDHSRLRARVNCPEMAICDLRAIEKAYRKLRPRMLHTRHMNGC
jgi:hypothetical protein